MFGAKTINRHAMLMNRMAETLGVDMSQAVGTGQLPAQEWRSAVLRCTGCAEPADCVHWLSDHHDERMDDTPDYCRNRELLKALRPE